MQVNIAVIGERIKEVREKSGLTQQGFADSINVSRSTLSQIEIGVTKPSIDILAIINSKYGVPYEYLLGEKGNLKSNLKGNLKEFLHSSVASESEAAYGKRGVPLVSIEALAGKANSHFTIEQKDIMGMYVVPDFTNIQFMLRVTGQSMYPKYNSGDVVACRIITESKFVQWNKVHVLATKDQGILIKRLKKGSDDKHYMAISDNKEYDPFEIPTNDIYSIALVVGVIRLE